MQVVSIWIILVRFLGTQDSTPKHCAQRVLLSRGTRFVDGDHRDLTAQQAACFSALFRHDTPLAEYQKRAGTWQSKQTIEERLAASRKERTSLAGFEVAFAFPFVERFSQREFAETERTPYPETVTVSALSQMWIFAVYELLCTWRWRIQQLKRQAQKPAEPLSAAHSHLAGMFYEKQLAQLRELPSYAKKLDRAMTRMQPLYRLIKALRINLAKHEVPGMNDVAALAPGYGRFDRMNESISWQIDLGNNSVQLVSRREIADELKNQVIDNR
jgi:hypothetical protein